MAGKPVFKEKPFPNDLEGRLDAVTNALNTEFKSVILLHVDSSPKEGSEIRYYLGRS